MRCLSCKKDFISKRKDARYCSDACRKADSRRIKSDNKADKMSEIIKKDVRDNGTLKGKIQITEADEWRRDYLEDNAEFFTQQLEDTKDCPVCNDVRATYGSKSLYKFCSVHLRIPRLA